MNIHQNFKSNIAEQALATAYVERRSQLPGASDLSLMALRDAAMARFEVLGLPHRRIEDWHYTDLRRILGEVASVGVARAGKSVDADAIQTAFSALGPARLVFVDGHFDAAHSDLENLGEGVEIRPMSDGPLPAWAIEEITARRPDGEHAIFDLGLALMSDGALIRVKAGHKPSRPVEIVNLAQGGGVMVRHVVCLEDGASLQLIENEIGSSALSISALSVTLGDTSCLDHVKVQDCSQDACVHVAPMVAEVGRAATINTFTLTLGSALVREERHIRFGGEDGRGSISGAFLLSGKTHGDMTLKIDHALRGGESREVFRGIVDDRAKSVVQTNVVVARHAQKTDARQAVHVLILSDEAEHNTKPELEIYADDVQCAHGATIGALDENSLFYLMSRGIPRAVAEALLIEAFVSGAMEEITDTDTRQIVSGLASARLDERSAHG